MATARPRGAHDRGAHDRGAHEGREGAAGGPRGGRGPRGRQGGRRNCATCGSATRPAAPTRGCGGAARVAGGPQELRVVEEGPLAVNDLAAGAAGGLRNCGGASGAAGAPGAAGAAGAPRGGPRGLQRPARGEYRAPERLPGGPGVWGPGGRMLIEPATNALAETGHFQARRAYDSPSECPPHSKTQTRAPLFNQAPRRSWAYPHHSV